MTTEQLEQVEQLAYRLFKPRQIAIIMELNVEDFDARCHIIELPEAKAYWKGRYQQIAELRENIIKAAKNGSNPAQEQLLAIIREEDKDITI